MEMALTGLKLGRAQGVKRAVRHQLKDNELFRVFSDCCISNQLSTLNSIKFVTELAVSFSPSFQVSGPKSAEY
jgi:hypothetical protein